MNSLESLIDYTFKDKSLLQHAMVHSSYLNEHALKKEDCNERLEFLGDAILESVSSIYLYHRFPEMMEGDMSKLRASLVCEKALAEAAKKISLGDYLILGNGMEKNGGRNNDSVISDAFEALIAAIYLDGGFEFAKKFIDSFVLTAVKDNIDFGDAKSKLQELLQDRNLSAVYELLEVTGPEHDKTFTVGVTVSGKMYGKGVGHSKKEAQQQAAFETIAMIRNPGTCI